MGIHVNNLLDNHSTNKSVILGSDYNQSYPWNALPAVQTTSGCVQISSNAENEDLAYVRTIIEVYVSMPIALAGIIGNILSIIVLYNHKPLQSTTVVLEAIACTDTAVLVSTLLLRCFRYVEWQSYNDIYSYIFISVMPVLYVIRMANTWLTVLLTVDRYIAVCHPLRAQQLCNLSRTKIFICIIIMFSIVFNIPRCFEYQLVDLCTSSYGFKMWIPLMTNWYYTIIYRMITFFIIMYLIPMTLLIVLNARLLVVLYKSQAYRASNLRFHQSKSSGATSDSSKVVSYSRELQGGREGGPGSRNNSDDQLCRRGGGNDPSRATRTITMMAVTIVLICVLCNVSTIVAHVMYSVAEGLGIWKSLDLTRRYLTIVSNLFVTINSAVNFLIYCFYSKKFRIVLARLVKTQLTRCGVCRRCRGLVPDAYGSTDFSTTGRGHGGSLVTATTEVRGGRGGGGRFNFNSSFSNSTRQSIVSTRDRVSVTSIKLLPYKQTTPSKRDSTHSIDIGHSKHYEDVMMSRISESSSPPPCYE